jgi:thiamine-phosphate diphosphorylase
MHYAGDAFFDAVQHALLGGVDAVLVREKHLTSAKLLGLASHLREMTYAARARLIIHTQADVAGAVDADGVHLASADIHSVAAVRKWLNDPLKTVSVSCHNADELGQAAACGADFALLSPVFPTASHPGAAYLGAELFQQLVSKAALPVVALGGIDTNNCHALQGRSMAVISVLLGAVDVTLAAKQLCAVVGEAR